MIYGVVISYDRSLMFEVILESYFFVSKFNIVDLLREILGIKGKLDNSVEEVLNEYEKVCYFCYCLVYRYGKLGIRNVIELGLDCYKNCIEKFLDFNYGSF